MAVATGGRPLTLTDEKIDEIRQMLVSGCFLPEVAGAVGVHIGTLKRWKQQGHAAKAKAEAGEELSEADRLYLRFFDMVAQARSETKVLAWGHLKRHMATNWRACVYVLTVLDPATYAIYRRPEGELPTAEQVEQAMDALATTGEVSPEDRAAVVSVLADHVARKRRERGAVALEDAERAGDG